MSLAAKEKIDNLLKWLMSQVNSYPVNFILFVFAVFYLVDSEEGKKAKAKSFIDYGHVNKLEKGYSWTLKHGFASANFFWLTLMS